MYFSVNFLQVINASIIENFKHFVLNERHF